MKPFDDFPESGTKLLGRPRTDASCRTGYGLALQQMTGQSACAYCGEDLTSDYYRWLLMQVDHVIPVSVGRLLGIPERYIEDAINKVLACSGCNGFLNRYSPITEPPGSWTIAQFVDLRDMVFADRKKRIEERRSVEIEIFRSRPWDSPPPRPLAATQTIPDRPRFFLAFELDEIPGVIEFIDNDAGYLSWVADNPEGFVVNAGRNPKASYLILHRSTCGTITGKPARGLVWTRDFIKSCALDVGALDRWAQLHTGGNVRPCGLCKPQGTIAAGLN